MKQMDDTDLQELFQALAPPRGHQERFRKKLEQQHKQNPNGLHGLLLLLPSGSWDG